MFLDCPGAMLHKLNLKFYELDTASWFKYCKKTSGAENTAFSALLRIVTKAIKISEVKIAGGDAQHFPKSRLEPFS